VTSLGASWRPGSPSVSGAEVAFGSRWVSRNSEKLGIKRTEEHSPEEPVEEYGEGNQENVVNTGWDELWL
jgi:hypothetical protein